MPAGRPTKYKDDMPDRVRALLSEGYSQAACAGKLGVSVDRFIEYKKKYPEFLEAVKDGEAASQSWWEDRGRDACLNGEFNPTVWWRNMQNRFGWREKTEHTGEDGGPIVVQVVKHSDE